MVQSDLSVGQALLPAGLRRGTRLLGCIGVRVRLLDQHALSAHRLLGPCGIGFGSRQTRPDGRDAANVGRTLEPPNLLIEPGQLVPNRLQRLLGRGQVALQAGHQVALVLQARCRTLATEPKLTDLIGAKACERKPLRLLFLKDPVGGIRNRQALVQCLTECDQVIECPGDLQSALCGQRRQGLTEKLGHLREAAQTTGEVRFAEEQQPVDQTVQVAPVPEAEQMLGNLRFVRFHPIVDLTVGPETRSECARIQQVAAGVQEVEVFVKPRTIQQQEPPGAHGIGIAGVADEGQPQRQIWRMLRVGLPVPGPLGGHQRGARRMLVSAAITRSSGTQHVRGDLPLGAAKRIQPMGPHVTVQRQHRRDQRCRFSGRIVSGQEQPPVRDIEGEQSEVPVVAQDHAVQLIARRRADGSAQAGGKFFGRGGQGGDATGHAVQSVLNIGGLFLAADEGSTRYVTQ